MLIPLGVEPASYFRRTTGVAPPHSGHIVSHTDLHPLKMLLVFYSAAVSHHVNIHPVFEGKFYLPKIHGRPCSLLLWEIKNEAVRHQPVGPLNWRDKDAGNGLSMCTCQAAKYETLSSSYIYQITQTIMHARSFAVRGSDLQRL